ncbi:hypothetical protein B0H66DRAFT_533545 [Apodospora peruviana]|uniref:2EXR domain-containing protein n=1 Tax=Apodospora peruviana TaxID=516989 RepID=A0AAE0I5P9_9PEZI|nr:hypothetical protein B0H66DRAFT_533545 [Apodospora peruviana]
MSEQPAFPQFAKLPPELRLMVWEKFMASGLPPKDDTKHTDKSPGRVYRNIVMPAPDMLVTVFLDTNHPRHQVHYIAQRQSGTSGLFNKRVRDLHTSRPVVPLTALASVNREARKVATRVVAREAREDLHDSLILDYADDAAGLIPEYDHSKWPKINHARDMLYFSYPAYQPYARLTYGTGHLAEMVYRAVNYSSISCDDNVEKGYA